jgi:hypothetical protein
MSRATVLPLLALGLVLAGCPLPQALPEYSAGTVTPPRIVVDDQLAPRNDAFDGAVTFIPAGCTSLMRSLSAQIVDNNTVESVEARWFVNYDYRDASHSRIWKSSVIGPNGDTTNLTRAVQAFTFDLYDPPPPYGAPSLLGPPYRDAGVLRVVELVVSNGFDPSATPDVVGNVPAVNRAPRSGFETQVYRWVFLTTSSIPCN